MTAHASATAQPRPIDTLIEARWIVPVEPVGLVLENHALALKGDTIVDLLPTLEARQRYAPRKTFQLTDHLLTPGFVNLHTHAAMALLRGFADDLPLMRWLEDKIWPAEAKHANAAFVRDGSLLAAAEMLRGGTTCCSDMYFYPEAATEAFLEAGIRAAVGITTIEFPTSYACDADDYLAKGLAARDRFRDEALISFSLAPHAPYTVADKTFEKIGTLSAQLELPIHIHVHETRQEIEDSLRLHGCRPLARLERLGLLGPELIAVHAVHLNPEEIASLAHHGCHVAHCPTSNMKLASGIPAMADFLAKGGNAGLGTDGAASNNRLDMIQEMRHAALLGKVGSGNAAALDAHTVLHMATLAGARALGLGDAIGSLKPGKKADLCAIGINEWSSQPCFDPVSHLVYVLGREAVSHVWVGGKLRVDNAQFTDIDTAKLFALARLWQNTISS
ncbi:MAG TPA: TRZ/ATZ family hydrolase [Rhodocyclaceae bacterium]|nr:TRZ/ATZ family hydrolase [Rhodocyclaceae bacterium]